jgi:hypothetical protein
MEGRGWNVVTPAPAVDSTLLYVVSNSDLQEAHMQLEIRMFFSYYFEELSNNIGSRTGDKTKHCSWIHRKRQAQQTTSPVNDKPC